MNRQDEVIAELDPFRSPDAIQLFAALNGIEPTIWRRLVVPWTWHLGQLHLTIQAAFGWCDCHLHEFRIGGVAYGDPENNEWDNDTSARTFDEAELRLLDFAREPGRSFNYLYDFGDCWDHTLTVEKLLGLDTDPRAATCIGGARARPPEDVGGSSGYEDFLSICRTRATQSITARSVGAAGITIRLGSTSKSSTKTCGRLSSPRCGGGSINQGRNAPYPNRKRSILPA